MCFIRHRFNNPNTEKLTIRNSAKEIRRHKLNILNPSLNTLSVTIIINITGKMMNQLLKISILIMLVLRILSSPRTMIINKKYKTTKTDNFVLKRRYIFLFNRCVNTFAKIPMANKIKLSFIFKIAIASPNNKGL